MKAKCRAWRVYPRVCGGSEVDIVGKPFGEGLSPRVRGKPSGGERDDHRCRSIPACAGEAAQRGAVIVGAMVYPRVCGGSR